MTLVSQSPPEIEGSSSVSAVVFPPTSGEGSLRTKRTPGRRKDKRVTTRETHTPPSSHPGGGSPCRSRRALSTPCPPRVIPGPRAVAFLAHSVARALHATFVYVVWWNFVVARAFLRVYTWSGATLSWFARSGSSEAFWLGPPLGSREGLQTRGGFLSQIL